MSTVLPYVALGLMGVSTIMQYQGTMAQADYAAQSAEYNKRLYEQQAAQKKKEGKIAAGQFEKQGQQVLGQQRAGYGASGVTMEGTPAAVALATEREIEYDRKILEAGYSADVADLLNQGKIASWRGRSESSALRWAAPIGLLTGGANIASMYSRVA